MIEVDMNQEENDKIRKELMLNPDGKKNSTDKM
jgi:hypothetical protein